MSKPPRIPGAPTLWRHGDGAPPSGVHAMLVPGEHAPLFALGLPETLRGAAREQVAARQLAEQLSLSPDSFEMHPFLAKGRKIWERVFVIDAARIAAWRKESGRACRAIVPDFMGLPTAAGLWTLKADDATATLQVRLGPEDGFTSEVDLALAQLQKLDAPKAVLRLGPEHAEIDAFLVGLGVPILRDKPGLRKAGLKLMRWGDATSGASLLEAPRAALEQIATAIRRWRMFFVASALGVAAWLGAVWVETEALQEKATHAQSQTEAMVRSHFVPAGPILDVRAQVTAVVDAVPEVVEIPETALTPLQQLQTAAPQLLAEGVSLASAEYRPGGGLLVSLDAVDFAALDAVVVGLQDAAFLVEQVDARAQQSGGVSAQLRLELLP